VHTIVTLLGRQSGVNGRATWTTHSVHARYAFVVRAAMQRVVKQSETTPRARAQTNNTTE
jgi:hypothetical protein